MSGPPRCLAKPRGASQCAGVLEPLRVLDHCSGCLRKLELIWMVWSCFTHIRAPYGVQVGVRVSRRRGDSRGPGAPNWLIFRTFSLLFRIF